MLALSDALPTGHRAMANPTLQLHFGCGRATPPISHSHNWPFGRMQHFFVQNWTKKLFFAHKDPKTNFDAWMILQKPVLSFTGNDFLKMANLKVISSSATLNKALLHPCYLRMISLHVLIYKGVSPQSSWNLQMFGFPSLAASSHQRDITLIKILPSNLWYKAHQILKLKCFSSRLAVLFV